MAKYNTRAPARPPAQAGPITAVATPGARTYEGNTGYARDAKSDAYLIATTTLDLTADAFYEGGDARVKRYITAIRETAVADPDWTYQFLTWLRQKGNIRTAAIVGAVEAARAMVAAGIPGGRLLIANVLTRPDEPGEALAYHISRYGKKFPKAIKRGVAAAAARLYHERSLLKYDTASHGIRFGDVLDLTHPSPAPLNQLWQRPLFRYALNRRHGREDLGELAQWLPVIAANQQLRADAQTDPAALVNAVRLDAAGMTWEDALSLAGNRVPKDALWTALISSMGYMALLRNLRNFDEAGLSDQVATQIGARLADPEQVAKSRQLPLRFLSAYRAVNSVRWAWPLEQALNHSLGNIPRLTGRTLILIDTSQSMNDDMSDRSGLRRWDAAVSFGLALAARCDTADVYSYSWAKVHARNYGRIGAQLPPTGPGDENPTMAFPTRTGESLLKGIERWKTGGFFINGGTDTVGAIRHTLRADHTRVVLLTDEQAGVSVGEVGREVPATTPLFTFNLAGYQHGHAETGPNRIVLGGLTDAMFGLIPNAEAGASGVWPWDTSAGRPGYQVPVGAVTRTAGVE